MKKILFALCVVLALVSCNKDKNNGGNTGGGSTTGTMKFLNGEGTGKLQLGVGSTESLSLDGADISDCDLTTSNSEVVSILGYNIQGVSEGTATITATLKTDNSKTATLEVTVVDALKAITWDQIMYMQSSEEWQGDGNEYFICRLRRHRTDVESDVKLTAVTTYFTDNAADTVGMQSWVGGLTVDDLKGKWYPLYTKEGDTIGLFYDSCIVCRFWLMSTNAYFDGDGAFAISGENAPVMDFTDYCKHDGQYIFCLGDRTFVEDPRYADQQYIPQGCEPEYCTGYVQIGHFDTASYMGMWREYFSTGEFPEDYEYWTDRDSKINMYYNYYDEESGESGISGFACGYPVTGDDGLCNIYIASDDREGNYWCKAEYYYFNAKMFTNWEYYGLGYDYDEEQDVLYYTGEMGPIQDITYTGGAYPSSKPGKNGVRRNSHEMQPMRATAFQKQVSVNSTIGATLRMILGTRK